MKRIKYLSIVLILSVLSIYLYRNYVYYKVSYNPFLEFAADTPSGFHFSENQPDDTINKASHDINTNNLIFKYLSGMKLVPVNEKASGNKLYKHEKNVYYSGMFEFAQQSENKLFINEIYLDNLTTLYISSNKPGFRNGYYKIIDSKFDYKYINDLIAHCES